MASPGERQAKLSFYNLSPETARAIPELHVSDFMRPHYFGSMRIARKIHPDSGALADAQQDELWYAIGDLGKQTGWRLRSPTSLQLITCGTLAVHNALRRVDTEDIKRHGKDTATSILAHTRSRFVRPHATRMSFVDTPFPAEPTQELRIHYDVDHPANAALGREQGVIRTELARSLCLSVGRIILAAPYVTLGTVKTNETDPSELELPAIIPRIAYAGRGHSDKVETHSWESYVECAPTTELVTIAEQHGHIVESGTILNK